MNDYEGALEDLTRADRLRPDDTFTLRYLFSHFSRVFSIVKANLFVWCMKLTVYCCVRKCRALGAAKSSLGDRRGALQVLNAANRLQPNDMWTLRLVA